MDVDLIKRGTKKLLGTNDYSTFRSSSCHAKSPIKTIKSIKVKSVKNKIEIEFNSQSFLQQQVRSMVGCLKYLGEKKWDLKKFDKEFKPEFVLFSAGFDAHIDDPLAQLRLNSKDFYQLTKRTLEISKSFCDGKVVSILEGGYDLKALQESSKRHVDALIEFN